MDALYILRLQTFPQHILMYLCACVDDRMYHDATREGFEAVPQDLPATQVLGVCIGHRGKPNLALPSKTCPLVQVRVNRRISLRCTNHVRPPSLSFQRLLTTRVPFLCQQGCHQAGLGCTAGMEALRVAAEHLPQTHNLRRSHADSLHNLLSVELQQLGYGHGGAYGASRGGNVPPNVIVLRPYGQAELALNLDARSERKEEILAAYRGGVGAGLPFSCCQQCAGHRAGGMDDCVEVCVIIIMDMRGDAVQESSMLGISEEGPLVAEDGCLGRPEEWA